MTMPVNQVRLPKGLIKEVNSLVNKGFYANKSEVIRDAVRILLLERHIGSIPNTGDSVEEIGAIRKKLSKGKFNLKGINRLGKK